MPHGKMEFRRGGQGARPPNRSGQEGLWFKPRQTSAHSAPTSSVYYMQIRERQRHRGHFTLILQRKICVAFLAHFERCLPSGMLSE